MLIIKEYFRKKKSSTAQQQWKEALVEENTIIKVKVLSDNENKKKISEEWRKGKV